MPAGLFERLYYKLPAPAQDAAFSAYGFYLAKSRYSPSFQRHLAELRQSEWWSFEKIRDYQDQQFSQVVKHAYATVPFYRVWLESNGVDAKSIKTCDDLRRLPILTKDVVRSEHRRMVSTAIKPSSLIKSLTSGTSGSPLSVMQTKEGLSFQWAIWWRHKARFGLLPGNRHLTLGARIPVSQKRTSPPFWRNDYYNKRVYLSTYHISKSTLADIANLLQENQFEFFTGYSSALYSLALLLDEYSFDIGSPPKQIVTGSDALLPQHSALLSKIFKAPVTEQYGMTEFAGNMSKCPHGNFHVDFECCFIESLPIAGSDSTQLLLTGWGNPAMPFIRYDIGDHATPLKGSCPCGRHSPAFTSLNGRLEDYIITPDGRKLVGMNQVFEYAEHAKEIQLYQVSHDSVEFRIVPGSGFGEKDKSALIREFQRRAGTDMRVSFRIVDQVERSRSGKFKAVISLAAES